MRSRKAACLPTQLSQRGQLAGGQPISELMAQALAHPELISLAAGFVDQTTLPVEPTHTAMEALLAEESLARVALQYGNTPGYAPLREILLARQLAADGRQPSERDLTIDRVVLTAGSNQLLHLVAEALCDPGDIVLCAAPTYFVFLGTLANMGVRAVSVAADQQGMIPAAVDEQLARLDKAGDLQRVRAIYCTSYFDNPTSVSLAAERRPQLVDIAERWSGSQRIYILEDAAYRELRYQGEDIPSLHGHDESGESVVLAGTFSKSFAPGIRVGWGILPSELVEAVCQLKGNYDFGSPHLPQHLMHKVLELDLYDSHVGRLRQGYRAKLQAMIAAAEECLQDIPGVHWFHPLGGLYVWLTLPPEIDAGTHGLLFQKAMEAGVLYVPGGYCYAGQGVPRRDHTIRLSFGVQPAERIRVGMQALAAAIRDVLSAAPPQK